MQNARVQCTLIVDGLPLSVTSDELNAKFALYGNVIWAKVVTDRYRRSMSFGYVFMDTEAAERAIRAMNGQTLGCGPMTIARTAMPPIPPL